MDREWLTWPQAAELAGCSETTIETHIRTGRIAHRSGRGRKDGTVLRESVEAFGAWWADETARRERRRAGRAAQVSAPIEPPEPEGWIQASEAAQRLGFAHSDQIVYLARVGKFEARKHRRRWWVRAADIDAYATDRARWVSWLTAADIVGCSHETIRRAVAAGKIEKRDVHRTQPSLSRESVEAFAATWRR